jgi:hypothetical protein
MGHLLIVIPSKRAASNLVEDQIDRERIQEGMALARIEDNARILVHVAQMALLGVGVALSVSSEMAGEVAAASGKIEIIIKEGREDPASSKEEVVEVEVNKIYWMQR